MSQLKFRVWDTEVQHMYYRNPHISIDMKGKVYNLQTGNEGNVLEVMYCTELLDKKGRKIYEGDIIAIPDCYIDRILDDGSGPQEDFFHLSVVCFKDGSFGADIKDRGEIFIDKGFTTFFEIYNECDSSEIEVIGNVYINPEMIEE